MIMKEKIAELEQKRKDLQYRSWEMLENEKYSEADCKAVSAEITKLEEQIVELKKKQGIISGWKTLEKVKDENRQRTSRKSSKNS